MRVHYDKLPVSVNQLTGTRGLREFRRILWGFQFQLKKTVLDSARHF